METTHFFLFIETKELEAKVFFGAGGGGALLCPTSLARRRFLEGEPCLGDRITVSRETGEQQRGGSNKGKGPFRLRGQEALPGLEHAAVRSSAARRSHECVSSMLSQTCWKREKTLSFTLAETWDKETWGLHTVY